MRGANLNSKGTVQTADVNGLFPVVPNYQLAMIMNWNFLDCFRLKSEKKIQDQRIVERQQDYNLILINLKTQDVRAI